MCREISMQMSRIDDRIADPKMYYDDQAIDGFIRYCEAELTLTDGGDVILLDTFKLWAEDALSWFYFIDRTVPEVDPITRETHYIRKKIKKRLTNKQYIILPRGGAKSMYLSFMQSYFLNIDTTTTFQITVAPTMRQAEEVMTPIQTAIIRSRGPLFQFLTEGSVRSTKGSLMNQPKLASTKEGIKNFITNSILQIRPMSVDKLQGLRCKYATVDEWLSGDTREDPFTAIEQGASKISDYLLIGASSEGTIRNGIGDTIKMELMSILRGEYLNPHASIWYYRLDDLSEVGDPSMWVKANPNLDFTVSYETYQLEVEKAENAPASRNEILAKRFNIPMEGYTYFFTYEETKPHRRQSFLKMPCAMGCDLSRGDDFCAFTFLFPLRGDAFGVKTRCYITELTLRNLPLALRAKYERFMDEGTLIVMDGTVLDMNEVYEDLSNFVDESEYDVRSVGFDPYNSTEFINSWVQENGSFGVEKVIQGAKTESVPLGELKKLASERLLIFDEEMMTFTMGNCVVLEDTNGNRKLYKVRNDQKIDSVAALMDAFVSFKLNKENFE